jgi:hypothetical protein
MFYDIIFYICVIMADFGFLWRCARITDNQPSYLNEFCGVHGVEKKCDKNVTGELFFSPGLQHCNLVIYFTLC